MLSLLTGQAGCCKPSGTVDTEFLVKSTAKTALSASHSVIEKKVVIFLLLLTCSVSSPTSFFLS